MHSKASNDRKASQKITYVCDQTTLYFLTKLGSFDTKVFGFLLETGQKAFSNYPEALQPPEPEPTSYDPTTWRRLWDQPLWQTGRGCGQNPTRVNEAAINTEISHLVPNGTGFFVHPKYFACIMRFYLFVLTLVTDLFARLLAGPNSWTVEPLIA